MVTQITRRSIRLALDTRIRPAALVKPVFTPSAPSSRQRSLLWLVRHRSPIFTDRVETVFRKMGFSMA